MRKLSVMLVPYFFDIYVAHRLVLVGRVNFFTFYGAHSLIFMLSVKGYSCCAFIFLLLPHAFTDILVAHSRLFLLRIYWLTFVPHIRWHSHRIFVLICDEKFIIYACAADTWRRTFIRTYSTWVFNYLC